MIKVCHLTSVHRPNDPRIFFKECVSVAKAGFKTFLVATDCNEEIIDDVSIINVKGPGGSRIARMIGTVNKVYRKALDIDADIYHLHDPELLRIALKLKRKGKKVIYDAHEDLPRQILGKYYIWKPLRKLIASIVERFENYAASRMDYIITATPHIRERFIKVNKHSIDVNNFPITENDTETQEWENKHPEICYIGGITEVRGILNVVNAMDNTKGIKLNLAGNYTPVGFHKELKRSAGWSKVITYGFVDRNKANEIMQRSIAGIVTFLPLPNHTNSQPNKLFEYMSAGIPVITSNFPLWREIVEGNDCGICVDPLNPKEIAEAINYLIKNDAVAKEMGANGLKAIETKYNWGLEEIKLLNIYRQLT